MTVVRKDCSVYVIYRHPRTSTSIHSTLAPSVTGIVSLLLLPTFRPFKESGKASPACLPHSCIPTRLATSDLYIVLTGDVFDLFYRASVTEHLRRLLPLQWNHHFSGHTSVLNRVSWMLTTISGGLNSKYDLT